MDSEDVVSAPNSFLEAQLLLDSAHAECKLYKIHKELVDQLMQCNQLRLEHSLLQVKRAEQDLLSAELHVGWARLVIQRYGYSTSTLGPPLLSMDRDGEFLPIPVDFPS